MVAKVVTNSRYNINRDTTQYYTTINVSTCKDIGVLSCKYRSCVIAAQIPTTTNKQHISTEKEESRTFIITLISLQMHTISQAISHSTMGESKRAREGRRSQDLLQKHAIYTSYKLSPHTHSQDLTWQECQAKEEALHLGASLPKTKVQPSKSKWMKSNG